MRLPMLLALLASLVLASAVVAVPAFAQTTTPEAGAAQDEDTTTGETSGDTTDVDCADFSTQEEAQDYFDQNPDAADLDDDGDGIACEALASEDDPSGGVATGGGGLSLDGGASASAGGTGGAIAALALVALLAAGSGVLLLRRRPQRR